MLAQQIGPTAPSYRLGFSARFREGCAYGDLQVRSTS
jgi:hypothetical protein